MRYNDDKLDTDACIRIANELRERSVSRENLYVLFSISGKHIQESMEYVVLSEYIGKTLGIIKAEADKVLDEIMEDYSKKDYTCTFFERVVLHVGTIKENKKNDM